MTVLVTGATGFIGLNLLAHVEGTDRDPVAMVRASSSTARLPEGVETVEADLSDPDSLAAALAGVDSVVHLAAAVYDTGAMAGTNVAGTERLVEAAADADVDRFVFVSTIGAHPAVPADADSTYQQSKVASEELLFGRDHPFEVSAVYPTYIFGPRDYRLTRYEHVRPVATNRVLVPPLYTDAKYNVVHVDDVVGTIAHCLDGAPGRHLVTGPNVTNKQFLTTIARHTPGKCRVVSVPYGVIKYGVKPAMDLLHRVGISPVPGAGFTDREDFGTVREALTERAPVRQRDWRAAIGDTVAWYDRVGLL
ncbi:NAD-dependent epimerase/dehydratase family protein [Haloarcula onubensis]|uniref:NAD-dependent epimerase/dehydratase family protein n=1 Tax=Haloarcula onubensis TaxID=2950539 RepID=A0ABU2FUU4_9EURY|nr:NAD-dependent epimerase/dehydratase family protein [Halomicroarcula sp. S3CR25-11]MDS0284535.1 NAD-dependent epimerase/dehydratase family protein [Halomicroarcula sp. S3CR25-11]